MPFWVNALLRKRLVDLLESLEREARELRALARTTLTGGNALELELAAIDCDQAAAQLRAILSAGLPA